MKKISVVIKGHPTSISLEPEFHAELMKIARQKSQSMAGLIGEIDETRSPEQNLSSALRLLVLSWLKQQIENQKS